MNFRKLLIIILVMLGTVALYLNHFSNDKTSYEDSEIKIVDNDNNYFILTDVYSLKISKSHGGAIVSIYPNNTKNILVSPDLDNMGIKYLGNSHLHYSEFRWYDQYEPFDILYIPKNFKLELSKYNKNISINTIGKTGDLKYNITYDLKKEYFYTNVNWKLYGLSTFSALLYVIPFDIQKINDYTIIENNKMVMKKDGTNEIIVYIKNGNIPMSVWADEDRYNLAFHLDSIDEYNTVRLSHSEGNFSFKFEFITPKTPKIITTPDQSIIVENWSFY